jgi:prephenate dehydrogenase
MFKKVAIIGVGLIGGSIGLALKKKRISRQILGVCRHQSSINKAKRVRAIDQGSLDYKSAVQDAELIILASPVGQIIKTARVISPYLKKGCIVTDAGSTKEELVRRIEKIIPRGCYFVGAHPLAGSEKRGVDVARADLFKGAICILTKTAKTNLSALRKMAKFWQLLGSRIKILTPREHDRVVAEISHLPHLAATQLIEVAQRSLTFAARGFFDTTRIASSDAEIWTDIFLTNKRFIIQAIDRYVSRLKQVRGLIRKDDRRKLSAGFKKAKTLRDALQTR